MADAHTFNGPYTGDELARLAFPLGGMGAGMVCLEGTGGLNHVSVRHRPEMEHAPLCFAAVSLRSPVEVARVLEGPVPLRKAYSAGHAPRQPLGLPRFAEVSFLARFPFAHLELSDASVPLAVSLTGYSPFTPNDADAASLPVAALEYSLVNQQSVPVAGTFSFHLENFLRRPKGRAHVDPMPGGFVLEQDGTQEEPWERASFAVFTDDSDARGDCRWFRGRWFDELTMLWQRVEAGEPREEGAYEEGEPSSGGSLWVPFALGPGQQRRIRVMLAWYVPRSSISAGSSSCGCKSGCTKECYRPWYASRFGDVRQVADYFRRSYDDLRGASEDFSRALFESDLPPEVLEAVSANLSILKSPTVLRQHDGRFWAWEGSNDQEGCCHGTCEHVHNYAQAMPHLFHALERGVREVELDECMDERGHQNFRCPLPIAKADHGFHSAADGQLGGLLKVYREWRIGGDTDWVRRLFPKLRLSLDFCIEEWDPGRTGALEEPQHNTYDIEFWGPNGMCTSIYAAALAAFVRIGDALGEDVQAYRALLGRSVERLERELYDGEYFVQRVNWNGLRAGDPTKLQSLGTDYSPEARALLESDGPKYQYGKGCLSDGMFGAWLAEVCGVENVFDRAKVRSHLLSVRKHNFRSDLSAHANPQRPCYALGGEAGLLLCSWPKGGKPLLPFPYSDEVWTGIEYQVASHLISVGEVEHGLELVRAARRRYDGRFRNPFDEVECGHFYARAMASYALLGALTGARYDAVERVLYLRPKVKGDFRGLLSTATGFGSVGVRGGAPFLDVVSGTIAVDRIDYRPAT
jgi:uncharacterized protein (DUF608 family)